MKPRIERVLEAALRKRAEETPRLAQAVEAAHHFTATIYAGHGYRTARTETLAEARALAPTLEAKANNHRRAMIYAVTPDGFSHFIPDWF